MKVHELIDNLKTLPQDAEVLHLWDGKARTTINVVYESKGGDVITSDYDMVCYTTETRPKDAPNSEDSRYWNTGSKHNTVLK